MYIVSYVQLTVIQQSIATTDYPPFYVTGGTVYVVQL
jgi:hypothetical protein